MNTPTSLPSDLIDLLAEFESSKVEYLLVGGQAVALHGFPRFTKDADLWLRDEPANLRRAREALERFGAASISEKLRRRFRCRVPEVQGSRQ